VGVCARYMFQMQLMHNEKDFTPKSEIFRSENSIKISTSNFVYSNYQLFVCPVSVISRIKQPSKISIIQIVKILKKLSIYIKIMKIESELIEFLA
jgi:predicted RNase H-related nuclease YkuK (DUF458 family)